MDLKDPRSLDKRLETYHTIYWERRELQRKIVPFNCFLTPSYFPPPQGATKVLSDSPGLVEWLVGLAFSYRSLPDGQAPLVLFSDDKFNFGLAPQTFGLVISSNSLPEGRPHLFIFVSPCCGNRIITNVRREVRLIFKSQSCANCVEGKISREGPLMGPEYLQSSFVNIGKFLHRFVAVQLSLSELPL